MPSTVFIDKSLPAIEATWLNEVDAVAFNLELLAIASLSSTADQLPYFTGAGTAALASLTPAARSVLDDADVATMRATLSAAASGANSDITSLSGLTTVLSRAQGGTGLSTAGASGNVLTSDGTNWTSSASTAVNAVPVRQTVLSCPVDVNGFPAFGGSTGSATVTATGTLVATSANGFGASGAVDRVGQITDPSWTGLSTNGTMYLYLDIAADGVCTTGATTLAPIYQHGGTPAVTSNQATFNIQQMQMFVGNGSTAPQTHRVFIGEVTISGGVVTVIVWYALMGRYSSGWFSTASNTGYIKSHNIGIPTQFLDSACLWRKNSSFQSWQVHSWLETSYSRGAAAAYTNLTGVLRTSNYAPPDYNTSPISLTDTDNMAGEAVFAISRRW